MSASAQGFRVAIIGAGASGVMALIKLRQAGYEDVTVFEKAGDLGGTWRDNTYPGLTCDVASLAYCYSFEPNAEWSQIFAPGREIHDYIKAVARKHDVEQFIRYDEEAVRAEYADGLWRLETVKGDRGLFNAVLTATGLLHHPVLPDIAGLDSFAGAAFHSSRWNHDIAMTGKRVGVIGTGSTATQIVSAVVGEAAKLTLFQRTAQWILPLPNESVAEEQKAIYRANPTLLSEEYQRINYDAGVKFAAALVGENPKVFASIERACQENLDNSVPDPELRRKLTPDYKIGCKRLVMSESFYAAIQRPNAELVVEGIERIEPEGVRTRDGRLHPLDVLVLATGFNTHQFFRPMQVIGEDGHSLDTAWADKNEGYMGVVTPGFPNWFMIGGPNSPIGNFSWLLTAENQMAYILQLLDLLRLGQARRIAPKVEATEAFNAAIAAKLPGTVWASGCTSWYVDAKGRVASWPWSYEKFLSDMRRPVLADFEIQ